MLFKDLFNIELPIIQAPMAGVQDSRLALAVSSAGGLGSLPCGMLSNDKIHEELTTLKSQTNKPININFFCHKLPLFNDEKESKWREVLKPYFTEFGVNTDEIVTSASRKPFSHDVADILEEFRPEIVSFHFGLPENDLLSRVKSWGATVLSSATTVREAKWLEANGADIIIAQGSEAGGHRGMFLSDDITTQTGTFALLPQIINNVKIPVVAAGGISDTRGVTAAISMGAIAVQVGTAYLLCPEANTRPIHRNAIKNKALDNTVITNLFSGKPARSIVNRIIKEIGPMNDNVPEYPYASVAISELRKKAEQIGVDDFTSLWCGQNSSGCKEISAAELTQELASDLS